MLYYLAQPTNLYGLLLDQLSFIPTDLEIIAVECNKITRFMQTKDPGDGPYLLFLDDALPLHIFFKATQDDINAITRIRLTEGLPEFNYLEGIPHDQRIFLTEITSTQVQ